MDNQNNKVTVDMVKRDFNIIKNFDDGHVDQAIQDATTQVKQDQIDDAHQTRAVITYAKHLLYQDWFMSYGGVISAGTFGNTQSMANFNGQDNYLIEYNNLVANYGISEELGAAWSED